MANPEDIGLFQEVEIDFAEAYHESRRQMGTKGTDMDQLLYNVGLMYLNTPAKWQDPYLALMYEIERRNEMMLELALPS